MSRRQRDDLRRYLEQQLARSLGAATEFGAELASERAPGPMARPRSELDRHLADAISTSIRTALAGPVPAGKELTG